MTNVNDTQLPDDAHIMFIQDGNALFHGITGIPHNFHLISHWLFDKITQRIKLIFNTDMYQEGLIKVMERYQYGSIEKLIIGGQLTKKPVDWNKFLMDSQKKSQLVNVMNEVWWSDAFALKLVLRKVGSVVQGNCHLLQSNDGVAA